MNENGVSQIFCRLGGRLNAPRKSYAKKHKAKANTFKAELHARLAELFGRAAPKRARIAVLDEHRYGLLLLRRRDLIRHLRGRLREHHQQHLRHFFFHWLTSI